MQLRANKASAASIYISRQTTIITTRMKLMI